MATAPTKATVAPAAAPAVQAPSTIVQPARERVFAPEPTEAPRTPPSKFSAKQLAEHQAGAEALANYN